MSSESVASLLAANKSVLHLTASNKICCKLTGHEMPPSVSVIKEYLGSKKYKAAKEWEEFNLESVSQYIIPHKTATNKVWCQLTEQTLNKRPEEILRHVNGKKYQKRKEEYEKFVAQQEEEEIDSDSDTESVSDNSFEVNGNTKAVDDLSDLLGDKLDDDDVEDNHRRARSEKTTIIMDNEESTKKAPKKVQNRKKKSSSNEKMRPRKRTKPSDDK